MVFKWFWNKVTIGSEGECGTLHVVLQQCGELARLVLVFVLVLVLVLVNLRKQ
jgi:hypothetical protein